MISDSSKWFPTIRSDCWQFGFSKFWKDSWYFRMIPNVSKKISTFLVNWIFEKTNVWVSRRFGVISADSNLFLPIRNDFCRFRIVFDVSGRFLTFQNVFDVSEWYLMIPNVRIPDASERFSTFRHNFCRFGFIYIRFKIFLTNSISEQFLTICNNFHIPD